MDTTPPLPFHAARPMQRRVSLCKLACTLTAVVLLLISLLMLRRPHLPPVAAAYAKSGTALSRSASMHMLTDGAPAHPAGGQKSAHADAAAAPAEDADMAELLAAHDAAAADGAVLAATQFRGRRMSGSIPVAEAMAASHTVSPDTGAADESASHVTLPVDWQDDGDVAAGTQQGSVHLVASRAAVAAVLPHLASPAEQQHAAEAVMLRAAALPSGATTTSVDATATSEGTAAAAATGHLDSAAGAAAALAVTAAPPPEPAASAASAALPAAVSTLSVAAGQLADCMSPASDAAAEAFTVRDFMNGKPARCGRLVNLSLQMHCNTAHRFNNQAKVRIHVQADASHGARQRQTVWLRRHRHHGSQHGPPAPC